MDSTATTPTARTATMNDVPGVARVLGRAMANDPLLRWLFPNNFTRIAQSTRFSALFAGFAYVPGGDTHLVEMDEDLVRGPVVRGTALWEPPDGRLENGAFLLRALPHLVSMVGPSRLPELARYFGEISKARPEQPHWYLAMLGTDPAARGRGIGSQLLRAGMSEADADGVPVYLETMNSANLGYYEKHGFHVVRAINILQTPEVYCLLRPAAD